MNKKRILPFTLAALIAGSAVGGAALAKESGHADPDMQAIAKAKVSLQQAIATAEQQTSGRAVSADLDEQNGVPRIEVEVAGPQGIKTVLVDAETGRVTATHAGDQGDADND